MDSINKYFLDHFKYFWNNLGKKAFKGRITRNSIGCIFFFYIYLLLIGIIDAIIDMVFSTIMNLKSFFGCYISIDSISNSSSWISLEKSS